MNDTIASEFGNRIRLRVCGILFKEDAILLAEHSGIGEKGRLLIPPGGGVEFGESVQDALKREFLEETGIRIRVDELLTIHEYIEPPLHAVEFFFLVTAESRQQPHTGYDPELKENQIIQNVNFVTFEKLRIMDSRNKHQILREIRDKKGLLNLKGRFKLS